MQIKYKFKTHIKHEIVTIDSLYINSLIVIYCIYIFEMSQFCQISEYHRSVLPIYDAASFIVRPNIDSKYIADVKCSMQLCIGKKF